MQSIIQLHHALSSLTVTVCMCEQNTARPRCPAAFLFLAVLHFQSISAPNCNMCMRMCACPFYKYTHTVQNLQHLYLSEASQKHLARDAECVQNPEHIVQKPTEKSPTLPSLVCSVLLRHTQVLLPSILLASKKLLSMRASAANAASSLAS